MSKIKVVGSGEPKEKGRYDAPSKFKQARETFIFYRAMLFPDWVWVIVLAAIWLSILPMLFAVLTQNLFAGGVTGLGFIVSMTSFVLLWDTYTPKWRTMAWGMIGSIGLAVLAMMNFEPFNGIMFLVMGPVGLFMLLRVNMNGRKMMINRSLRKDTDDIAEDNESHDTDEQRVTSDK